MIPERNRRRPATAGVTLIEMLLALAVSAMVGLAGFVLLESTLRTQSGVAGRLEALAQQTRTFELFSRDVEHALSAQFVGPKELELRHHAYLVTWSGDGEVLTRQLTFQNRPPITQILLSENAEISGAGLGAVALRIVGAALHRLAALPNGAVR
mgnify:CR=1 FL=1